MTSGLTAFYFRSIRAHHSLESPPGFEERRQIGISARPQGDQPPIGEPCPGHLDSRFRGNDEGNGFRSNARNDVSFLDSAGTCIYTYSVNTRIDISETRACHCLAARRQARAITRTFEEKLRPHGLRATQFSILAVLTLKGTTTVRALADVLGLERTTLTRVSGVLERKGLVSTEKSSDARQRPLCITPTGRRTLENAFPAWKEAQELVESRLAGPVRQLG